MVKVNLENITKRFGEVIAADQINLEIEDGEFFTFLGPSGCGKTTTMRIIAGLEYPTEGKIFYDDKDVTQLPSHKRNTGMVFQNYALWPHMTVFDNVAYGLRVRKVSDEEVRNRVQEALELVHLGGLGDRFPNQLSGGQQQRVALARVLVINPDILLLDEPLSNLDAKLRVEMREEIKEIQRELGITTIYVTHDQEEAMAISDRIAIQNYGAIIQVGTPRDVYNKPIDLFIATFIGKGALLEGQVIKCNDENIEVKVNGIRIEGIKTCTEELNEGDRVACVLRPEKFSITQPDIPYNVIEGELEWSAFLGPVTEVKLNLGQSTIFIDAPSSLRAESGEVLKVYLPKEDTIILPWMELDNISSHYHSSNAPA
ncbi:ATP-binding cassette domain-containing protein [Candidatus Bathyarchaeota archaeon]|nr:ATP-binding cassette domain-containing protein [Candidatus Bathyarchaeota archaeon]